MMKGQILLVLAFCGLAMGQYRMNQILGDIMEQPALKKLNKLSQWKALGNLAKTAEASSNLKQSIQSIVDSVEGVKSPPKFCNKLDCPPFEDVAPEHEGYELRDYSKSTWVTTQMKGVDYEAASRDMFQKLFQYISGSNDQKMKIVMTCPVLIRIIPGAGPTCESDFTMSFYLNDTLAKRGPPKPTDKTVYLSSMPDNMMVYVRSFGGYDMFSVKPWLEQAQELAQSLGKVSYDKTHFYTAGYDSPFKLFNRHNEIWFLKN